MLTNGLVAGSSKFCMHYRESACWERFRESLEGRERDFLFRNCLFLLLFFTQRQNILCYFEYKIAPSGAWRVLTYTIDSCCHAEVQRYVYQRIYPLVNSRYLHGQWFQNMKEKQRWRAIFWAWFCKQGDGARNIIARRPSSCIPIECIHLNCNILRGWGCSWHFSWGGVG